MKVHGKVSLGVISIFVVILVAWALHKKNVLLTDAQTASVKLITSIKGIVKYLSHFALLYKAFSVHMKHQTVRKRSLPQAIELVEEVDSCLETI